MTVMEEIIRLASNGRTLEFHATEQRLHITLQLGDGTGASCEFPWREAVQRPHADDRLRLTLDMMYSDWKRERSRRGGKPKRIDDE